MKANFPDQARFELLSAYIDNRATPTERKQVQQWLDSDREFKKTYLRLSQLAQSIKNIPVSASSCSEDLSLRVFAKIDGQKQFKKLGVAISLGFLALLGFVFCLPKYFIAQNSLQLQDHDSLAITLNRPIIRLP
ncbi:MAG: anti-sigma factor [Cyanobacteriota bacterium ELA615]|jgi:hypothetical protein